MGRSAIRGEGAGIAVQPSRADRREIVRAGRTEVSPQGEVNLCVKVSAARRRHWASEAKRQGTTMTSVIIDALSDRFGEPG